ncbi:MAG: lysophospholipid acyltransferase family protein [Acidobacteriota bacterium]|nr:lysophospholipid acyltransferase family protein [Acidobacteriota bacterium]
MKSTFKALAVGLWTAFCLTWVLVAKLAAKLLRRSPYPWLGLPYRLWARGSGRILGMHTTVKGTPPEMPFLLVTNHLSYTDILLLAGQRECAFIAKGEIAGWPGAGTICRAVDTIFIDRENRRDVVRAGSKIAEALEQGRGVVLFAEATTSPGDTILPLKTSLLAPAANRQIPVHYATISYRTEPGDPPASRDVCWWGDEGFGPHFQRLLRLQRFYATVHFSRDPIQDENRKLLAKRLRAAMLETFIPVT